MNDKYCSARFKTGTELDNALAAALGCGQSASEAAESAKLAAEKASLAQNYANATYQDATAATQAVADAEAHALAAAASAEEAKKAAASGGGGSGGGGVSSWNDLTDKPFYSEFLTEEILSVASLPFDNTTSGYALYTAENTYYDMTPGRAYTVTWAGEEYQCEAKAFEDTENLSSGVVLGEVNMYVPNTPSGNNEPFGVACIRYEGSLEVTYILSHNGVYNGPVEIRFEGEVVKTIDPKYLPEGIGSGGGAKHWDELEGRPFYSEFEAIVDTTLEIDPDMGQGMLADPIGLVAGQKYTVTWNGVEYVSTAQPFDGEGVPMVVLGDLSGLPGGGVSTGEPFLIVEVPPEIAAEMGASGMVQPLDGSTSVTVVIGSEITKTLDPKYLPKHLQFGPEQREKVLFEKEQYIPNASLVNLTQRTDLVAGETYNVYWAGVKYKCVAQYADLDDKTSLVGLGNQSLQNKDYGFTSNNEPFFIGAFTFDKGLESEYYQTSIWSAEARVTVSVKITLDYEHVVPIETKYLPIFKRENGDTLYWDGNLTGREVAGFFVRVSDKVPTLDDFADGIQLSLSNGSTGAVPSGNMVSMGPVMLNSLCPYFIVVLEDGAAVEDLVFPKKGIYFVCDPEFYVESLTIVGYTGFVVERIDPRYLPGGSARETVTLTADLIPPADSDTFLQVSREELGAAINALNNGGRVFGTFGGKPVEVVDLWLDSIDRFDRVTFKTSEQDTYVLRYPIYDVSRLKLLGNADNVALSTPKVERNDIILRASDDRERSFRITVNSAGVLTATEVT